ncbi:sigma-70 family RNA polymerase sigma factor [Ornithinimicrobium ciconiae]|uniref:Sigma-70 family RNA polymerase sigma factor n=1 Tax=Ornithinimicrobium ciconiae TaxID=2594265 RepID=A0A516G7I3_9MICO|nr:sigma-70 family RNA polymerase sigma factor [Ornithinimicrobium ciconiae]QDO87455.1 sigma-70 family RNA polymerase sigma factor [Ornithinimicrobium ciconiae]
MGLEPDVGLADYYPLAYRRLVGTLRVMGVPGADAGEVAQEAFVRLIPRWDQIRSYDSPDGWLRTVAWRIWLNRRRHDKRTFALDELPEPPQPEGVHAADRLSLLAALKDLPEGHREAVVLHYLHDLPIARIATELAVAEGTVKSRLSRARSALATALTLEVDDV